MSEKFGNSKRLSDLVATSCGLGEYLTSTNEYLAQCAACGHTRASHTSPFGTSIPCEVERIYDDGEHYYSAEVAALERSLAEKDARIAKYEAALERFFDEVASLKRQLREALVGGQDDK